MLDLVVVERCRVSGVGGRGCGGGSMRKKNEGTDGDGTTTKGGDETNDKTPQGCRWWNRLDMRNTGVQGAESRIWWAKRAAKSERAGVFGSVTSLGSDRNAAHGAMGAAIRAQ
jgi:hypothetical protein